MENYGRPLCDAYVARKSSMWDSCAFCCHYKREHAFLEASIWHPAGPFIMGWRVVPNPDYRGEVVA